MAISYRASTKGTTTVTAPAGTTVGDVLVLVAARNANTAFSAPSGWTTLRAGGAAGSFASLYVVIAYHVFTGASPTSWTLANATGHSCAAYTGVDNTNPFVIENAAASAGTSPVTTPTVNNTNASGWRVCGWTASAYNNSTPAYSGYSPADTERIEQSASNVAAAITDSTTTIAAGNTSVSATVSSLGSAPGWGAVGAWIGVLNPSGSAVGVSASDTATVTDSGSVVAQIPDTDAASVTEQATVRTTAGDTAAVDDSAAVRVAATDAVVGTDQAGVAVAASDSASVTDNAVVAVALPATDTLTVSDSATVIVRGADAATTTDTATLPAATQISSDAASVTDTATVTVRASDSATITDNALVTNNAQSTDAATVTDTAAVRPAGTDVAAVDDQATVAATVPAAEPVAVADTARVGQAVTDTATVVDSATVRIVAAPDTLASSELAIASNLNQTVDMVNVVDSARVIIRAAPDAVVVDDIAVAGVSGVPIRGRHVARVQPEQRTRKVEAEDRVYRVPGDRRTRRAR